MRWAKVGEWVAVFIIGVLTTIVTMAFAIFPKISEKAEKSYVDESISTAKTECVTYTDKQISNVKEIANKDKEELLEAIESIRQEQSKSTDRIINAIKSK